MSEPQIQEYMRAAERLSLALTEWFQDLWEKTQPVTVSGIMDLLYAEELNYPTGDEERDVFI